MGTTGFSPLIAVEWEIGTGEWVFPWGIVFLEWWPCGDEKQSAKPLTDAVITWRTQAYWSVMHPRWYRSKRGKAKILFKHEGCIQTNSALYREWTGPWLTMVEHTQILKPAYIQHGWKVTRTETVWRVHQGLDCKICLYTVMRTIIVTPISNWNLNFEYWLGWLPQDICSLCYCSQDECYSSFKDFFSRMPSGHHCMHHVE